MSSILHSGKVSFVNHDKDYIMIEYEVNGKKKVVNGSTLEKNLTKKHQFHIGDTVTFKVGLTGRGDRLGAFDITYRFNTALDVLINKAKTENNFIGYLKVIDDKYFVKEIDSYLFFHVPLSPWQIKPTEAELNEAVTFALENTEKKDKISAKLYNNKYIPEFYTAVKMNKAGTPVEAKVQRIGAHAVYAGIINNTIRVKLPLIPGVQIGDTIMVKIVHLTPFKIIVEAL